MAVHLLEGLKVGGLRQRQIIDQKTLPRIRMPNRKGFTADPRPYAPKS